MLFTGMASAFTSTPAPAQTTSTDSVTFVSVVDGDTIKTSAGTVRLIGIDTPERGECGYDEASMLIGATVAPGAPITLELPAGQNDRDRHGRLLRFVTTEAGVELGLLQVQSGHALARYDSSDGYPGHPKEGEYHAAQLAIMGANGEVVTSGCQAAAGVVPPVQPAAPEAPVAPAEDAPTDAWWQQFPSCGALKRSNSGYPTGPFNRDNPAEAAIYEWFAFGTGNNGDGEGDGLACE